MVDEPVAAPAASTAGSRGRLLDIIRASGPVSRVEIAQLAGLTQASVSTIVRGLMVGGLVREVGTAQSTGGKRRTLLTITPTARTAVGVHLASDSIVYVVTDMGGGLLGRIRREGAGETDPASIVERLAVEIDGLLTALAVARATVVGIGIVAAGPIDWSAGVVIGSPSMRHWDGFPLRDALSAATGLPVVIDKDATAAAVGEFWGGRVDAPLSFACLYMDTGIGAGIVIDGLALRGSASNAGEIGHVSLDVHGERCYCGNRGCLQIFAAPPTVVRTAISRGVIDRPPSSEPVGRTFDALARRAVNHEPGPLGIIRESAEYIAEAAVTLVNLTDLDLVVLAGPGFAIAGAVYIEVVRAALAERAFARESHGIDVRFSSNARDAAALGASALVLQQMLAPRR